MNLETRCVSFTVGKVLIDAANKPLLLYSSLWKAAEDSSSFLENSHGL